MPVLVFGDGSDILRQNFVIFRIMIPSIARKSAIAAVAFFGTLGVLSVGYSAYS